MALLTKRKYRLMISLQNSVLSSAVAILQSLSAIHLLVNMWPGSSSGVARYRLIISFSFMGNSLSEKWPKIHGSSLLAASCFACSSQKVSNSGSKMGISPSDSLMDPRALFLQYVCMKFQWGQKGAWNPPSWKSVGLDLLVEKRLLCEKWWLTFRSLGGAPLYVLPTSHRIKTKLVKDKWFGFVCPGSRVLILWCKWFAKMLIVFVGTDTVQANGIKKLSFRIN